MTLAEIVAQARTLNLQERKELVKLLVDTLDSPPQKRRSILEFGGIAAELAGDEDPQDYVRRIRGEWDDRP